MSPHGATDPADPSGGRGLAHDRQPVPGRRDARVDDLRVVDDADYDDGDDVDGDDDETGLFAPRWYPGSDGDVDGGLFAPRWTLGRPLGSGLPGGGFAPWA